MAYWLFKSEPSTWSWDDQKKKGKKGEPWNGVRNYQANNNMKAMKQGDLGFFYHSVDEKRIVGIVRVIGEHRPDPTDEKGKFGLVVIEAVEDMPKPVTLDDVKKEPALHEMVLANNSRLSVQPVRDEEWKLVCKMGGLKKAP
ncbi:MAG: EVE domain-containing protein [Alphaproteobacteria bacterium HGW-Alphaproteobacteria-12]|nr:MAG: EVE domain-containing protein [Alphaproteobacteria bacterium HGW-Alphaproteobacteria-12]